MRQYLWRGLCSSNRRWLQRLYRRRRYCPPRKRSTPSSQRLMPTWLRRQRQLSIIPRSVRRFRNCWLNVQSSPSLRLLSKLPRCLNLIRFRRGCLLQRRCRWKSRKSFHLLLLFRHLKSRLRLLRRSRQLRKPKLRHCHRVKTSCPCRSGDRAIALMTG